MNLGETLKKISAVREPEAKSKAAADFLKEASKRDDCKMLEAFLNCAIRGETQCGVGRMLVPDMREENIYFKNAGTGWVAYW